MICFGPRSAFVVADWQLGTGKCVSPLASSLIQTYSMPLQFHGDNLTRAYNPYVYLIWYSRAD
jgi:hypothetical protein